MKELFIEKDNLVRIVLTENNNVELIRFYEQDKAINTGDIITGIIRNVVSGLNSVFIDIGGRKNAFIYVRDKEKLKRYVKGALITVEVLREEISDKGAKVTDNFSISSLNMVVEKGNGYSFSKNLNASLFKKRFRDFLDEEFTGIHILYRSNSLKLTDEEFLREREKLTSKFKEILIASESSNNIKKHYSKINVLDKIISENKDIVIIHVNDQEIKKYIEENYSIECIFTDEVNLLDKFGIEKQIEKLRSRKVSLSNGGNIIIDKTEAMTVIDVNSKTFLKSDKDSVAFETNLLAIEQIHKQINLRNLGGIILCDMIDMEREDFINLINQKAQELFKNDTEMTKIYPLTDLNLLQIARRKDGKDLSYYTLLMKNNTKDKISFDYLLKLLKIEFSKLKDSYSIRDFLVTLDFEYEREMESLKEEVVNEINTKLNTDFNIIFQYHYINENFKIVPHIFNRGN